MRRWPLATAIGVLDTAMEILKFASYYPNDFRVAYSEH
jgi:hypothetical protein